MLHTKLDGIALVTGAASGIGQEVAWAFAEAGCTAVVFADINEKGADEAAIQSKVYATNASYQTLSIQVDIIDSNNVQSMVDRTVSEVGRIDYFVGCAGIPNLSSKITPDLDLELYNRVVDVNLRGAVNCLSAVARVMKGQEPRTYVPETPRTRRHASRTLGRGSIIILASSSAIMASLGMMAYCSAKHGVYGAVKVAALGLAKYDIRVNAVLPGTVDTPMMEAAFQRNPNLKPMVEKTIPLGGRMASVDEIADAVIFLSGPSMTYATGTGLGIDGGITVGFGRV